jgi:hypothetical protein
MLSVVMLNVSNNASMQSVVMLSVVVLNVVAPFFLRQRDGLEFISKLTLLSVFLMSGCGAMTFTLKANNIMTCSILKINDIH